MKFACPNCGSGSVGITSLFLCRSIADLECQECGHSWRETIWSVRGPIVREGNERDAVDFEPRDNRY